MKGLLRKAVKGSRKVVLRRSSRARGRSNANLFTIENEARSGGNTAKCFLVSLALCSFKLKHSDFPQQTRSSLEPQTLILYVAISTPKIFLLSAVRGRNLTKTLWTSLPTMSSSLGKIWYFAGQSLANRFGFLSETRSVHRRDYILPECIPRLAETRGLAGRFGLAHRPDISASHRKAVRGV